MYKCNNCGWEGDKREHNGSHYVCPECGIIITRFDKVPECKAYSLDECYRNLGDAIIGEAVREWDSLLNFEQLSNNVADKIIELISFFDSPQCELYGGIDKDLYVKNDVRFKRFLYLYEMRIYKDFINNLSKLYALGSAPDDKLYKYVNYKRHKVNLEWEQFKKDNKKTIDKIVEYTILKRTKNIDNKIKKYTDNGLTVEQARKQVFCDEVKKYEQKKQNIIKQ